MSNEPDFSDPLNDTELAELDRLLLENLPPMAPPGQRAGSLRQRLLARAAASAAESAPLRTIRARDGTWSKLREGVRVKPLWSGPSGNSVLLEFAPGASLPMHRHRHAEEGIVLRGRLQTDGLDLGAGDYHGSPPGSRHGRIRSDQGALAYLRGTSLGDPPGVLGELLGGLLPWSGGRSRTVYAADREGWIERAPGISIKLLASDGRIASYFCRVAPGTEAEGHLHAEDEECMMIEGDLFFGDLLLQAGDYQLAPAGSRHGRISSDVGALLFVRGQAS
jgi:quercetin dioxygenase-like cupin family protein